jgi:hypothetical protein
VNGKRVRWRYESAKRTVVVRTGRLRTNRRTTIRLR